jgi:hypothetical protein
MVCTLCSLMRGVTFEAIARAGIGMVGTTLIQICMTPEAQAMLFTLEKSNAVAGMRQVTRRTIPLHYGGVPVSAFCLILHRGVAAQTQSLLRSLECESSSLMTGSAFAPGYRGMD